MSAAESLNDNNCAIEKFNFHGDQLDVVRDDERVLVSIRRVCEALGLDLRTQLRKLHEKPWACVVMMTMHDISGRIQETACLDLDSLPMWLATIEASRVAEHVRPKLTRYQREAADVLADHFLGRRGQESAALGRVADALTTLATHMVTVTTVVAGLGSRIDAIEARAERNETGAGMVGPERAKQITGLVRQVVDTLAAGTAAHERPTIARAFRSAAYAALRAHLRVGMRPKLERLPEALLPAALNWLEGRLADARRSYAAAESTRQAELPWLLLRRDGAAA